MAIRSVGIFVPLPRMTRRAQRDERLVRREHGVELVAIPAHQLRALASVHLHRPATTENPQKL